MQPPPQAVPSGVAGPPPAGSLQSVSWASSLYRKRAGSSAPAAPTARPLQPVTDPFAFSRQALQSTPLGSLSKSSPPVLQGPAPSGFSQCPGLPVPHTNAGDSARAPCEPLPGPLPQPRAEGGLPSRSLLPSALPGPEADRGAEGGPGSEPEVPAPMYPPPYIPGVGPDRSHGGHLQGSTPGPERPLSTQDPLGGVVVPATHPHLPQPRQQTPGQWGPAQGGPQPPGQHDPPFPGRVENTVPRASSVPQLLFPSSLHQGASHEPYNPLMPLPGTLSSEGRSEVAYLQGGDHSGHSIGPDTFRHSPRVGTPWATQGFRQSPGGIKEKPPDPVLVNALAQGHGPENPMPHPPGTADSGMRSVFFPGGETENEENLCSEKAAAVGSCDIGGFSSSPGKAYAPPVARPGMGGTRQAFPRGSACEAAQQGEDVQPYCSQSAGVQHDRPALGSAAHGAWAEAVGPGTHGARGSQHENLENLEFMQNQEVLPYEPLSLDPATAGELFRYVPLPGPAGPRHGGAGLAGGGLPNLEAPDSALHPSRPDSVSSSFSSHSHSHRGPPSSVRPPELAGTFIQQEIGKPEDEAPGSFFKQIDSSPVGGEIAETAVRQGYHGSLSQPSTPSPPKPVGTFQTSANSSFEPVKSHVVGVRPVEADRANMVGEVKGTRARQKKRKPTVARPDASPGNLEQPPDNMETFHAPQVRPPFTTAMEAGQVLPYPGGSPLDPVLLVSEKKPSARAQGTVKCESPATTLWAQNELPDFGANVLLAPAAPALHVPAKPVPSEVVQPPEDGLSGEAGSAPLLQSQDSFGASENLENPPRMGEEEALHSQASSGYASSLSSPPTEPSHRQPVLIAQPDQSYNLAQPINLPASSSSPSEKGPSWRDTPAGHRPPVSGWTPGGESGAPAGSVATSQSSSLAQSSSQQGSGPEGASDTPANSLVQPLPHPGPKNLGESQKGPDAESLVPELVASPAGSAGVMLVPPVNGTSVPGGHKALCSSHQEETCGAPDLPATRPSGAAVGTYSPPCPDSPASQQAATSCPRPPGPGACVPDCFYQQVTGDAQDQQGVGTAQQDLVSPQQQTSPPLVPKALLPEPSNPGSPPAQEQSQNSAQPPVALAPADTGQQLLPRPQQSSSASVVSTGSSQAAARLEQQWLPSAAPTAGPLPQDWASYYYCRPLYDAYPPQYPSAYPDPGTASLYYQDIYSLYEPRYRPYDGTAPAYAENYRYPELERPSSRASHCSDRPSARPGFPEGYYGSRSGWSTQSDHYAGYYPSQYEYGDPGRWDRYHHSSRSRAPRAGDRRFWYDADSEPYRRESYAYGDRPEKCDDHWRYDPRFTGSFDDDPEPPRDPYGEEADRHSVHSEHSARSLRSAHSVASRRSSFSAHSQQSQVHRSHSVTAGPYETPPAPGSFHGDYTYGAYGSAQAFPEYGYPTDSGWPAVEPVPSRPTSPEKFSMPHICARFGPGGQLLKVIPNLPSEGQPALVEVHSMETLLQHTPEQEEMRSFPGPLGKGDTHKVDVINFAQNKATKCLQDESLLDKESASLLWNFIILLCRQNGTVVGTDIAELLLRDHKTVWLPGKSPNEANLIDFTNEAVEQVEEEESGEAQLSFLTDSQPAAANTLEKETERFRELLLYGRKKDALESAMKSGLWGHALLLASKMDGRTHARVMTRFANSLPINDPLQTVYQLMSGRMPAASTCCGDEKWGDWRPHLAMVLSNLSTSMDAGPRAMLTMGDTLASKGLLDAAHFCYLMAQVGFGVCTKKSAKLVLIGSNHSLPFVKFATNEAIQRTEAYEYAQSLGAQACPLPSFQVFKFVYSCRLAEMGLATQAFHYCEVVARAVLLQPHAYSLVLIGQLIQVASQLRLFDPQLKEKPEEESFLAPAWLVQLQHVEKQMKEGAVVWSLDGAFPPQRSSTPGSEAGQSDGPGLGQPATLGTDNPLLTLPVPSTEHLGQGVRLLPSAPQMLPDGLPASPAQMPVFPEPPRPDPAVLFPGPGLPPGSPSLPEGGHLLQEARSQGPGAVPRESPVRGLRSELRQEEFGGSFAHRVSRASQDSEILSGWDSANSVPMQPPLSLTSAPEVKRPPQAVKAAKESKKSESWFSRWLPSKRRTEAYLPDDKNKSIVWDEKKNQWVNLNEPEEEKKAPPPPPTSFPKAPQAGPTGPAGPPRASVNVFSRKAAGTRARYVDILNPSGPPRSDTAAPAPAELFAPLAPLPIPSNLFAPTSDTEEPQSGDGAGREGQGPAGGQASLESALEPKLSRCSSLSSLSREVSQHLNQVPGDHPLPPVPFHTPAQLAQASAMLGAAGQGGLARGSTQR